MSSPFDQSSYQVRLDWGVEGLARVSPADVVVVVDVLRFSSRVTAAVAAGEAVALDDAARAESINGAVVATAAAAGGGKVLLGGVSNATAVAKAIMAIQVARGERTSIAIIAAGEKTSSAPDASLRFSVEDLLGSGAIIAALGDLGIDHCSPDAAVAGEGARALRRATTHLLTASGSGRELAERGQGDEVRAAAVLDSHTAVPVLVGGRFRAFEG